MVAKNLNYLNCKSHLMSSGKITIGAEHYEEIAEKIIWHSTEEDLTITSAKSVILRGEEGGVEFKDYVPLDGIYTTHPNIEKVEFFDEKDNLLNQNTKNFLYGKKLKIKVTTKDVEDGKLIQVCLQGKSKSENQKFKSIKEFQWWIAVKNNQLETPLFALNLCWYNDDFENYDYETYKTKIEETNLNEFYAKASLNAEDVYLPLAGERLKPIAYKRNYEELIGLFNKDNLGKKDLVDSWENNFIRENNRIKTIVDEFIDFINSTLNTPEKDEDIIKQIKSRVAEDAKHLWDAAIQQVQTEKKLDDRPLYWARNKMQTYLKRHPLFYDDIDFDLSTVKSNTKQLADIVKLFEEKSRNYTGIDFSGANGKKKVLITGFDPFQLDSNPATFNPSGITALALNKQFDTIYIQTCIFPVRYEDFDNKVVEDVIKKYIGEVDMIITTSLNGGNPRFDIEKYAVEFRNGGSDNMFIGKSNTNNASRYKDNSGNNVTETSLPLLKIFGSMYSKPIVNNKIGNIPSSTGAWDNDYLSKSQRQIFEGMNKDRMGINGKVIICDTAITATTGSGGSYLSNEIMYRATKVRDSLNLKSKPVGHFHLGFNQDISLMYNAIDVVLQIVKKALQ